MSKPVIVIRNVEDSPDWIDRELVTAYLRTDYCIPSHSVRPFRVGAIDQGQLDWLEAQDTRTFAFITAWNPQSKMYSDKYNRLKNKQLAATLNRVAPLFLSGANNADDSLWPPEESFWAPGISRTTAVTLGRRYRQNAIVWWEKGALPELLWL